MQRFDPESSYARQKANLESHYSHWKNIPTGGAIDELLHNQAESFNEVARYGEALLQEKKWDTSLNYTSIAHQAKMVSKKFNRKVSARGYVIVSHTDEEGNNRLKNLGKYFSNLNALSNYDDIEKDEDATSASTLTLVPWTSTQATYTVPKGSIFTASNGKTYISTISKTIKALTSKWSTIVNDASLSKDFYANNGWNGIKYLTVPVVEGTEVTVELGTSTGTANQSFLLNTLSIEAADSVQTKEFLYLEVEDDDDKWYETRFLDDCDSTAKVFQLDITDDMSGTTIQFGDGLCGHIPLKGKKLTLHYLETNGSDGNIDSQYAMNPEFQLNGTSKLVDPRTNAESQFLTCTNVQLISGGKDLETLKEYKRNTEVNYRNNFSTIMQIDDFIDNIYKVTSVPLDLVKAYVDEREKDINGTTVEYNCLVINAIAIDGSDLDDLDKQQVISDVSYYMSPLISGVKDFAVEDYERVIVDSAISIETDESKIFDKDNISAEIESLIDSKYGVKSLDVYNNNLYSSDIEKTVLDSYGQYIKNIEIFNWIRLNCGSITYEWNLNNASSILTSGSSRNDTIFFSFKLNTSIFSVSNAIKDIKFGNKIDAIINIEPPSTSSEEAVSAVIYDMRSTSDSGINTIISDASIANDVKTCYSEDNSILMSQTVVSEKDSTSLKFYLAQLPSSLYALTYNEAIDESSSLSKSFIDMYQKNDNGEIEYVNGEPQTNPAYKLSDFSFNIDMSRYVAVIGVPLTYFKSLAELYSTDLSIAEYSSTVDSYLSGCKVSLSMLSNDRTLSNDDGLLLYVNSCKVVYE